MTNIKLIALDLDGTLLTSNKQISEENKLALAAARAKGIKIVLTTGRPLKAMDFFLHELDLADQADEYTITFNGGLVQRNTGEILDKTVLSYGDVHDMYDVAEKLRIPLDAIHEGYVYQIQSDQESRYHIFNTSLNFISVDFADLSSQLTYNKCVSAFDAELLDQALSQIPSEMKNKYGIFKSRDQILEWCPKTAHKANGLSKLITLLGIDRSQVMTFGDEENDLTMIEWAGVGVALQNATPAVKAVADIVTPLTNDEDGVAWAIKKYVLEEK